MTNEARGRRGGAAAPAAYGTTCFSAVLFVDYAGRIRFGKGECES